TERKLAGQDARELEARAELAGEAVGVAVEAEVVERHVMNAAIRVELQERLDAGGQLVIGAQLDGRLIEVAIYVAGGRAVGEDGLLIGGAVEGALERVVEAIELLGEAEAPADVGRDRKLGEADLDVGASGIVGRDDETAFEIDLRPRRHIDAAVDLAVEGRPVELMLTGIGRVAAVQIGSELVAEPVRAGLELRRHDRKERG